MLDKMNHIPLYIQLKDEILSKIKAGIWEVDSQIPSEKTLMDEYGVGRATVRESLSRLTNEGYLYKRQGVGTFVARKQPSLGFEPLISLTYSLEARGINSKNVVAEKRMIIPDKQLITRLKWKKSRECFYLKRIRYAEDIPIAIEDSYFAGDMKEYQGDFDFTSSLTRIILKELNIIITMVDQRIVPRTADKYEMEVLKISEGTLILNMERWIYIEGMEEPFYYLKFVIPGNIYSMPLY